MRWWTCREKDPLCSCGNVARREGLLTGQQTGSRHTEDSSSFSGRSSQCVVSNHNLSDILCPTHETVCLPFKG